MSTATRFSQLSIFHANVLCGISLASRTRFVLLLFPSTYLRIHADTACNVLGQLLVLGLDNHRGHGHHNASIIHFPPCIQRKRRCHAQNRGIQQYRQWPPPSIRIHGISPPIILRAQRRKGRGSQLFSICHSQISKTYY